MSTVTTNQTAYPIPSSSSPVAVPTYVGPYKIERELGRGAHGVVFRAAHRERPNEYVALKVVENRGSLDRLILEPEILSRLNHPGIVRLHDYFVEKGSLVMALEFIEGKELKEYAAQRKTLPPGEVRDFLVQMAQALDHAHGRDVLHRDIKLTNVLVEEQPNKPPRFVLTDFGISRISEGLQTTRHTGGTYHFMAPEQLRGRPEKASDLWALGVAAYVLLTGVQPFAGTTVEKLSQSIYFAIPKRPVELNPAAADEDLEQIIFSLLEKQPSVRLGSARELLMQLKAAPLPMATTANTTTANTYEKRLKRKSWWNWFGFWVSAVFMAGPYGIVPQLFVLAGALRFFEEQARISATKFVSFRVGGVFLMLIGTVLSLSFPQVFRDAVFSFLGLKDVYNRDAAVAFFVLEIVGVLCGMVLPFLVVYYFSRARQAEREVSLRQAITQSSISPDEYLKLLGEYVDFSPEDLQLRRRYIEALLSHRRPREAAVEAQLLLEQDPYDFSGSLLLAQAYFELGLYEQCRITCDRYLSWTGYSFEFEDLKARCPATT